MKNLSSYEVAVQLFSSGAYLSVNKKALKLFGPDITVFICNLVDKYDYFKSVGKIKVIDDKNNFFYLKHEQQMEQTGLTLHKLQVCKTFCKENGILQTKKYGIPCLEYYKINFNTLTDLVFSNASLKTDDEDAEVLISENPRSIQRRTRGLLKDIKIKDKNIKNIIPPKLSDIKEYCQERNSSVDPQVFFDWNVAKGWMMGKGKMKDWQAAIRTWEQRNKQTSSQVNQPNFKVSEYRPQYKYINGSIRYTLNPTDGEYYHKNGDKYVE
jgi:hypothetical protein